MRVWIVNQHAYTPSLSAGTRQYALARELIKRGHEVVIVATSFYHKAHKETKLQPGEVWKREVVDGVSFVWLRTPPYSGNTLARLWNMLVFTGRVWGEVGIGEEPKPDVIIGSSPHLFAAWAAERLARRYGIPFALEIRDLWPQNLVEMGGLSANHPLVWIMSMLESYLYRHSERILSAIPISRSALPQAISYMADRGAEQSRFVWLPNSVDLEMVPKMSQYRESKPFTFMYAGAHSMYGGLHVVLDAAEILQQERWEDRIRIRLVGDGPEKGHLQKSAMDRNIHIISFEPPVPKRQVYELLQQADAFLMIYNGAPICRWGISPNKLFDYMAAMRPVLYALGTEYSPIEEAQAGISVEPENPQAMADGIKALAQTPFAERIAMGERGRVFIEEHHSFEKLGERLEKVLLELLQDCP